MRRRHTTIRASRRARAILAISLAATSILGTVDAYVNAEGGDSDGAAARRQPDLVVSAGHVALRGSGGFWVIRSPRVRQFAWWHRTKNVGEVASPRTRTGVRFLLRRDLHREMAALPVPGLAPDGSRPGGGRFSVRIDERWKYGTHPTRACADAYEMVAERHEGNNCKRLHPFYVVPKALKGGVSGAVKLLSHEGVTLRWGGVLRFDISHGAPHGNEGLFDYRYVQGVLTYTVEGRSGPGGCTWSGTGRYSPSGHHDISLAFGRVPHYSANLELDPNFHFPLTITCPGLPPQVGEFNPALWGGSSWLNTGTHVRRLKDPGLTEISGLYHPFAHRGYRWNLLVEP